MAKSTKIIAALGVAGMLGAPTFAADPSSGTKEITDNVSVTVEAVCGFSTLDSATITDATPTATIANGGENDNIATHKFNVTCNRSNGYTVTAQASGLSDGNGHNIEFKSTSDYGTSKTADATKGYWTATVTDGTDAVSTAGGIIKSNSAANSMSTGESFSVTYKAYVGTNTPAGTYTGYVKYTISADPTI